MVINRLAHFCHFKNPYLSSNEIGFQKLLCAHKQNRLCVQYSVFSSLCPSRRTSATYPGLAATPRRPRWARPSCVPRPRSGNSYAEAARGLIMINMEARRVILSTSTDSSANYIIKHVKVQLPNKGLAIFCPCGGRPFTHFSQKSV